MTSPVHGEHERQSFSRPFLAALRPTTDGTPEGLGREPDAVRPYFVTQGRVHDEISGFETVYILTPGGSAGSTSCHLNIGISLN
jgi:hypothetical protein